MDEDEHYRATNGFGAAEPKAAESDGEAQKTMPEPLETYDNSAAIHEWERILAGDYYGSV